MSNIFQLIDRPIAFHRIFAKIAGSTSGGVFLSQAVYWSNRLPEDRDGWFWKSAIEWEEETCLTRKEQETIRKRLKQIGILEEKRIGLDPTIHYRLNLDQLLLMCQSRQAAHNTDQQQCADRTSGVRKIDNSSAQIGHQVCADRTSDLYTKTTPEITPEITSEREAHTHSEMDFSQLSSVKDQQLQETTQRSEEVKLTPSVNPKTCHRETQVDNATDREGISSANSPKKEKSFDEDFDLEADFWPVHEAPWKKGNRDYTPDMINAVDLTGGRYYRLENGSKNETAIKTRLRKLETASRQNFGQASIDARAALLDYWEVAQKLAANNPGSGCLTPADEPEYIPVDEGLAIMRRAMEAKTEELRRMKNAS